MQLFVSDFYSKDMGRFYLVPERRLRRAKSEPPALRKGSWNVTLQAFEGTRMFAKAKFLSSLLNNLGVVPNAADRVRISDAECSASILLRNLVNPKTSMSEDARRFLKRLRSLGNVPEANLTQTPRFSDDSKNIFFSSKGVARATEQRATPNRLPRNLRKRSRTPPRTTQLRGTRSLMSM